MWSQVHSQQEDAAGMNRCNTWISCRKNTFNPYSMENVTPWNLTRNKNYFLDTDH
jgi:hypothetical protein